MKTPHDELSRREFLSATTATLLALGLGGATEASAAAGPGRKAARRVGISDAAYARARTRAQALVAQMTLKEKISQVGAGAGAVPRLNVPGYNYYSNEALHGLCTGPAGDVVPGAAGARRRLEPGTDPAASTASSPTSAAPTTTSACIPPSP